MHSSRRRFMKTCAAAGVATMIPFRRAWASYNSPGALNWPATKYRTVLRGVGPGGIPVALPDRVFPGVTHYSLKVTEFSDQLHPSFDPTTLWGFSPSNALGEAGYPTRHLGGIIVAERGTATQLTVTNALPSVHPLPVDVSLPLVGGFPEAAGRYGGSGHNAVSTHLHGGLVPWPSDGGPMAWFTPAGHVGESYMSGFMRELNPSLAAGQAEYYYPNNQSARLLWYHDHAHEITRLNAYAGIASAYIIRDRFEAELRDKGLPDFVEAGGREIPLVIQDKTFVGPDIAIEDPTWFDVTAPKSHTIGSLWYPHVYEKPSRRDADRTYSPDPSCVPEMFGETMLVNGTMYPVANVEARRYRFRLLNACQARFLNIQLYLADGSADGITYNNRGTPTNAAGPDFFVIGSEGGFLPAPVWVPAAQAFDQEMLTSGLANMLVAPAERLDFVVDFTGQAGKDFILYTDAPAPFPAGDRDTDHFSGRHGQAKTEPGEGPDTRVVMKFVVGSALGTQDLPLAITGQDLSAGLDPFIVPPGVAVQNGTLNLPPGYPVRQLTLNEGFDSLGRLIQLVGPNTINPSIPTTYGRLYGDTPTETISRDGFGNAIEVWQIANLTADTHPIHFHLVNVQVLSRQPFDVRRYDGMPILTGPARNPDPIELGWKETVRMNPGEVTTVIANFKLPSVPFAVPASPRTGGAEYVWHCHILEHEEHDMMRPLVVF
jgi:spore coat protein A, manganese oxidase